MFTQEEQYTKLLEPILEPHQVPHNDNNVIYEVSSMEQNGRTAEQHPVNVEETRLSQVKGRLVEFKNQEIKFYEKIRGLEVQLEFKINRIESLTNELELLKKEKGLPEFADDTITDYTRPSPSVESNPNDFQNSSSSVSEIRESTIIISSKPEIKFVKAAERSTTNKVEIVKKPSVKYAKLYRKTTKRSTVRGNQRNWNNLKSQQLGKNFVMKKACYNCGGVDHLSYNCGKLVDHERSWAKNNNTHKSMSPRLAIHRPYKPPMRPVRPNMNVAQPKRTSFHKPAHSYVRWPFQETTQDLMIILIQKVKRLERELKARTSLTKIYKGQKEAEIQKAQKWLIKSSKKKLLTKKLEDSEAEHQV
nr:ubiquitin hydrolase [Tanacetum cinerariifolium]